MRTAFLLWFVFLASDNVVLALAAVVLWIRRRDSQLLSLIAAMLGAIALNDGMATITTLAMSDPDRAALAVSSNIGMLLVRGAFRVIRTAVVWVTVLNVIGTFDGAHKS